MFSKHGFLSVHHSKGIRFDQSVQYEYKVSKNKLILSCRKSCILNGFLSSVDIVNLRQITLDWLWASGISRKVLEAHKAI